MEATFPHVELPGVDRAEVAALDHVHHLAEQTRELKWLMFRALVAKGKHVYAGTVPGHVKAKRRATDKRARAARALHRKAAR
jgi:hypothetical protein